MADVHVVSVRALAEYACARGGIVSGAMLARRLREGREGHQALQRALPEGWQVEAALELEVELEGVRMRVQGRADALRAGAEEVEICEIKTTRCNPYELCQDDYPAHWAQAEIYGHLYCAGGGCASARLVLIYTDGRGREQRFRREYSASELAERFLNCARPYARLLRAQEDWRRDSGATLQSLRFPYPDYREGQREMAKYVFRALTHGGRALIEAPTGIGKTAAALYGALRALGTGKISAVFYLTARTTGRRAAEDAISMMRASGLKLRSVTLTAKEKICFQGRADCALCPYGEGYYDRRREALRQAMGGEAFTAEAVEALARAHEICPFELSLDLTQISDVVICDYNYVFDPRARLKRHFDKRSGAGLLIDEAHNLPERAREMYSAALSGTRAAQLRRRVAEAFGEGDPLSLALARLEAELTRADAEYDAARTPPEALARAAAALSDLAEQLRAGDEELDELAQDCAWFGRVARRFDEEAYRVLTRPEGDGRHIAVKLWCFAPEKYLDRALSRVGGAAMFSATLAPMDFYARLLAAPERARWLALESPFPRENLFVARLPVAVKYRERDASMEQVARILHAMAQAHPGNYLACFPSHSYMQKAYRYYRARFPDAQTICQEAQMSEVRRRAFIERFQAGRKDSMLAFIVLGGVFSEGVDLPDERLSGAAIVSTGIPQVNPEAELLREIYDDGCDGGTDAAYTYPGFRRVLQAAGRVIRTERDRGVVLLLDARYAAEKYAELMPAHWQLRRISSMSALNRQLHAFWSGKED